MTRVLLFFFLVIAVAGPANSQPAKGSAKREATPLAGSEELPLPPDRQLHAFYGLSRGLINNLQGVRISGRGWKLPKDARKNFREQITACVKQRTQMLEDAKQLDGIDDAFWSKVVATELSSELRLATLIDEVLTPEEQEAFFIENARELAGTVFYSPTFHRLAKLSDDQQQRIARKLERSLSLRSQMFRKPPSEFSGEPRVNFLEGLSITQLEVLFVLQARMDEDMSFEEYLTLAGQQEKDFLAGANREVRALLKDMTSESASRGRSH